MAAIPWLFLNDNHQKPAQNERHIQYTASKWPTAWAITIVFGVGALNNYTMIAWLPKILVSTAGVSQASAGLMLSLYNLAGIPHGFLVPTILSHTRHPWSVIAVGTGCLLTGYLGLLALPVYAWGWILFAGVGLMLIPVGLTLINLRSRTQDGAAVLSGFTQGAGYLFGAAGPIAVASLHSLSGSWNASLYFLLFTALLALGAGVVAARQKFIEDA